MALEDQGAYWLSEFKEIKNPYFGDAMLKCGEVKGIIEKDKPVYRKSSPSSQQPDAHQH